ncbi:hypothetical protein CSKR_107360, partial [Clonorchis sinensis]
EIHSFANKFGFCERLTWNPAESLVCDVSRQLNVLHQVASCSSCYDIRDIAIHVAENSSTAHDRFRPSSLLGIISGLESLESYDLLSTSKSTLAYRDFDVELTLMFEAMDESSIEITLNSLLSTRLGAVTHLTTEAKQMTLDLANLDGQIRNSWCSAPYFNGSREFGHHSDSCLALQYGHSDLY